ncbi:hypothetical protein J6590_019976 [Homalodisca vitripennis]|nr:hypothetical protein J6590_019976 [Homalodisca vitripennis]
MPCNKVSLKLAQRLTAYLASLHDGQLLVYKHTSKRCHCTRYPEHKLQVRETQSNQHRLQWDSNKIIDFSSFDRHRVVLPAAMGQEGDGQLEEGVKASCFQSLVLVVALSFMVCIRIWF